MAPDAADQPEQAELAVGEPQAGIAQEVSRLVKQLASDDKQQRGEAIVELGSLKEKAGAAASALVERLAETKEWVTVGNIGSAIAGHAEQALASIGTPAVPALIDGLKHEQIEVRRHAAGVESHLRRTAFRATGNRERLGGTDGLGEDRTQRSNPRGL